MHAYIIQNIKLYFEASTQRLGINVIKRKYDFPKIVQYERVLLIFYLIIQLIEKYMLPLIIFPIYLKY